MDKNVNLLEIIFIKIMEFDGNIFYLFVLGFFYYGCIIIFNWKWYMKEIERILKEVDYCDFEDLFDIIIRILKEYEV